MLFVVAKCWRDVEVHLGDSSCFVMMMTLPPSKSAVVSYDIGIADLEGRQGEQEIKRPSIHDVHDILKVLNSSFSLYS